MEISSGDARKLEKEERKIRSEMLKIRKGKFGKIGGKKLTVTEDVILRNQTQKWADMCEVEQNVSREQSRRQGKKRKNLEEEIMPEGRTGSAFEQEEENHWIQLLNNMTKIRSNEVWMTTSCMEKMSLEEKRKAAYGDSKKAGRCREEEEKEGSKKAGKSEKDGSEMDVWKFWEEKVENLDASKPTNQPEVVQENLKNSTKENFKLDREEESFINMTDSLKFRVKFGRNDEMHE